MMFNIDTLLLDPIYAAWGIDAVFTDKAGAQHPLRMLDKRDGTNLTAARGYSGSTTMLPRQINAEAAVVMIRFSECPHKPSGWTVVLPTLEGDRIYKVSSVDEKLQSGGEWVCTLKEA